jgi:hypothetical protein
MKFRKMACGGCRTREAAGLCKAPTYVVSNMADDSNLVFLLINKPGPTPCRAENPPNLDFQDVDIGSASSDGYRDFDRRGAPGGMPTEPDIDACWRPTWRPACNDDLDKPESPIARNRRLLAEGSNFWPSRRNRDADRTLRDWE